MVIVDLDIVKTYSPVTVFIELIRSQNFVEVLSKVPLFSGLCMTDVSIRLLFLLQFPCLLIIVSEIIQLLIITKM